MTKKPDLIIGVGDYIGGEDIRRRLAIGEFKKMWTNFNRKILEPFRQIGIVFAPSPGNHDASGYARLQREREQYVKFWNSHRPRLSYVDDTHFPYFYSYVYKGIFFISLDDVTPFHLNQREIQLPWIKRQLQSAEARSAQARIVYGHIPIYPLLDKDRHSRGNRGKYYEVLSNEQLHKTSKGLEAILLENNVNLSIFSHSHVYYAGKVRHKINGQTKEMRILSMPCLGPGARYLAGTNARSKNGFAWIKVDQGEISYEVHSYQDQIFDKNRLPRSINVPNATYLRDN